VQCKLNPSRSSGLHPDAYSALEAITVIHRITQGLNPANQRGNVHYSDGKINGNDYTGAVDISVRCLTEAQIKSLLGRLAEMGFAGWYRKNGQDGWTGPSHIHAVWAGCFLKPILQRQVESWIEGRTGLPGNQLYRFWQAPPYATEKVRTLYEMFK
jgi:hypothetical protein